jgi:hypothetical protein
MGAFGDIGQGFGQLTGSLLGMLLSGEGAEPRLEELRALWQNMQTPEFDMRNLSAPELKVVAEYFPEYYAAHRPDAAALAQDSPEVRKSQMENLEYPTRLREEGMPLAERSVVEDIGREIAKEHQGAVESGLESLKRRGRGGGGAEAAMRMEAAQQASELARGLAADQAREALLNRYRGAMGVGDQAGNIRATDIGLSSANADTINRYNQYLSQLLTQEARDNAAQAQAAQWANAAEKQRTADTNEMARYDTQLTNLNRQNQLTQQGFSNELARRQGEAGAIMEQAGWDAAEQRARNQAWQQSMAGAGRAIGGIGELVGSRMGGSPGGTMGGGMGSAMGSLMGSAGGGYGGGIAGGIGGQIYGQQMGNTLWGQQKPWYY